jgi:nucleoside-diphosphate-sugar epimerase
MKVLFTGASSFTGLWFVWELVAAGHEVVGVFRRPAAEYTDELRFERVALVSKSCRAVHACSFGDASFVSLIREGNWDVLCHHAADVTDYKSPDFDTIGAVQNNARNLPSVLETLKAAGCGKVVLTGTIFEGGEGAGSQGLPDLSPYGLSKALTARVFQFYCGRAGLALGKFVIPNPFGPYEEPRFTSYLIKGWLTGATPACSSPSYVRDNIHVSLLAKAYARFVADLPDAPGFAKINPSGYAESQGAFTLRLAQEMRPRFNIPCLVELKKQTEFPEPRVRINTDFLDVETVGWSESAAWDDLANYYLQRRG